MKPKDHWHLRPGQTLDDLRASMPPSSPRDLSIAVSMLFAGLKARQGSDADSAMMLKVYLSALQDWPLEAVQGAVGAFVSGRVDREGKAFVPAVPELLEEVKRQFNARVVRSETQGDAVMRDASSRYWAKRQNAIRRREEIIQSYRETFKEARKADLSFRYVDHICNEYKKATGRPLTIPKPKVGA
jgi:hypothetical protein